MLCCLLRENGYLNRVKCVFFSFSPLFLAWFIHGRALILTLGFCYALAICSISVLVEMLVVICQKLLYTQSHVLSFGCVTQGLFNDKKVCYNFIQNTFEIVIEDWVWDFFSIGKSWRLVKQSQVVGGVNKLHISTSTPVLDHNLKYKWQRWDRIKSEKGRKPGAKEYLYFYYLLLSFQMEYIATGGVNNLDEFEVLFHFYFYFFPYHFPLFSFLTIQEKKSKINFRACTSFVEQHWQS